MNPRPRQSCHGRAERRGETAKYKEKLCLVFTASLRQVNAIATSESKNLRTCQMRRRRGGGMKRRFTGGDEDNSVVAERRRRRCGGAVTIVTATTAIHRSLRVAPPLRFATSRGEFFHESGDVVSIQGGMGGVGRVWAVFSSASGVTERVVADGLGFNLGQTVPRGLTGIRPRSSPGWV